MLTVAVACLAVIVSYVTLTVAHGGVLQYKFGSATYKGFQAYETPVGQSSIQREWDVYDPITFSDDPNLSCNTNGAALAKQLSATVAAGTSVTAYWNPWPHTIGPVMVYMAQCGGSCTKAITSELSWFKIDEAGLINGTLAEGLWAMGQLVANNNSWTSTIPASLAPGEYMIRHELLAIHTPDIPQFYPECAQLIVTGSGSAVPSSEYLVKFPGAYLDSDPGVIIDIYLNDVSNYTIPGPAVWRP
ncbi:glycoside hydrolase family 61 protein [Mycena floridula]|nr:glycoside hydrolase family 61 protein [Mycena floridula]